MWIESTRYALAFACMALVVSTPLLAQEQGQYRSRILLDPLGEMSKSSEMSVSELEAQIDSIKEPYAKSSAGRFLARHAVEEGDYTSAIKYYRQALSARGLADVANREMLRELAQIYLLNEDYAEAARTLQRALDLKLQPEPGDFLLLAQAHYRLGDYVEVVAALDGIAANGLSLQTRQLRQALALYYRVGAYQQCEGILKQLLKLEPDNAEHWHQLAAVYLQQNKRRAALDQLALALEKQVPFTAPELQLLIDLQAASGNPYTAAVLLQEAMAQGNIPVDSGNQRKLFELWLQARERDKARTALQSAARSSGDTELYLYLAQLQMEDQQWQPMMDTVLGACSRQLNDRYVSRANLLLGVSLFKQGRKEAARSAWINATLVGGANDEAAQWLRFMNASPATKAELRQVRGPCYGSEGSKGRLAERSEQSVAATEVAAVEATDKFMQADQVKKVPVKNMPGTRYYAVSQSETLQALLPRLPALAVRLNTSLVKAGGTANGPVTLILLPGEDLRLAIPVRGAPQARGRYRVYNADGFKFAWLRLRQGANQVEPEMVLPAFREQVRAAGYSLTGQVRLEVIPGETPELELQVGVD